MGVLNPNNQYNIYLIKYSRQSKYLFLSASYSKTQPLAPPLQELQICNVTTSRLRNRCKLHLAVEQSLLGIFLEW